MVQGFFFFSFQFLFCFESLCSPGWHGAPCADQLASDLEIHCAPPPPLALKECTPAAGLMPLGYLAHRYKLQVALGPAHRLLGELLTVPPAADAVVASLVAPVLRLWEFFLKGQPRAPSFGSAHQDSMLSVTLSALNTKRAFWLPVLKPHGTIKEGDPSGIWSELVISPAPSF